VTTTLTDGTFAPTASARSASGARRAIGRPVWLIQVYVVLLVLIPPTQIFEPLGAAGTPATLVGLVALLHWAVAVLLPDEGLARTVVPVRIVVGLLAATVLARYAVLHVGYIPVDQLLTSDRILLGIFSWAGVALLAAEGLQDRAEVNRVVRTFVVMVAVMAVVGLLQFRAGIDLSSMARRIPGLHENGDLDSIQARSGFRRPAGTAAHPIEFGCVIAMALPLALHVARYDATWTRARRWLPVGLIAIGIPVAVSRSAILGAAVAGFVVFLGLDPRVRPKALVAVAGFVTLVYATTPGLLGTLRSFFLSTGSDSRINDYGRALAHIRRAPWLGHGPGTFIADSNKSNAFDNVLDNQYLLTLIEVGLIGLAVVLAYLLGTAFLARGARHRSNDPATRDLGQALAAASLASAVTSYTFDAFSFKMFAGVIPLCLGVAGALWATTRAGGPSGEDRRSGERSPMDAENLDTPVALVGAPAEDVPGDQEDGVAARAREDVPGDQEDRVAARAREDVPGDQADGVAARAAEVDLLAATTVIDLSDVTLELQDPTAEDPLRPPATPHGRSPAGAPDLRRIATLICATAAIILLVGLPFLVDRSESDRDAQTGVGTVTGVVPRDMSSTTFMGGPSSTADRSRVQPPAEQSPAVDSAAPGAGTTAQDRSVSDPATLGPTGATVPSTAVTEPTPTTATLSTTTTTSPTTTTSTTTTTTTTTDPGTP
jgi:polysaccharide biosynthesis protein PslJ